MEAYEGIVGMENPSLKDLFNTPPVSQNIGEPKSSAVSLLASFRAGASHRIASLITVFSEINSDLL